MAVDYGKDLGKMVLGNHPLAGVIGSLIIYFIVLILVLMFGEYLWNNFLVKAVTVVKPVTSVWQLLGIIILIKLLFC
tara:strand:+ start:560 stop:790 length:231 start_codon:yes stop_codon:yes gene_type:complete